MSVTFRENIRLLASSRRDALTDALTGLGNRRALMEDLEVEVGRRDQRRGRSGLVLLDLDGFKQYNDRFGHPMGDALLARLGQRLAEAFPHDRAYRLGGDEFCVLSARQRGDGRRGRRGRARGAHRARRRLRGRMLLGRGHDPARGTRRDRRDAHRGRAPVRAQGAPPALDRRQPDDRRPAAGARGARAGAARPPRPGRGPLGRGRPRDGHHAATSSTTSRAPPTCTTSARSPCRTRSCRSRASSTRSSGS